MEQFDVIVVGGGHAGCEAALVAARMGVNVAIITLRVGDFGTMSCNPAIGGLGKGHLVREIDALDGALGCVADVAGIQFRLLNRRKGPAVQGPRAQADRFLFQKHMQQTITQQPNLSVVIGEVVDLKVEGNRVIGVRLADDVEILAHAVVLTSGTFLRGVIHLGDEKWSAGRFGDQASVKLADRISDFDLPLGRLKTGTPPRLNKSSINWAQLEKQPGDEDPTFFSFLSYKAEADQISCAITHTNEKTHDIIRSNLKRSAMYSGNINGRGPRYCPSIEDKIVRFAEKTSHQIFLEPEGLTSSLVYPNGISTSLPADVQESYVQSIAGLEYAKIDQFGYAIEYDYVDPRSLDATLRVRNLNSLWLAGQINGTTGYEEAAAQGLVAGLNAALACLDREPQIFSRVDSYIGVMIDDLVTQGVTEPYRMFTSRAEYRLTVRADNADQRLTERGVSIGCVRETRRIAFDQKMASLQDARKTLELCQYTPQDLLNIGVPVSKDGSRRNGLEVLELSFVQDKLPEKLSQVWNIAPKTLEQLKREAMYRTYVERQTREIQALRSENELDLSAILNFSAIPGVSGELGGKLNAMRPSTIADAKKIEGMTPSCLVRLIAVVKSRVQKEPQTK